jgi:hypothetical protein
MNSVIAQELLRDTQLQSDAVYKAVAPMNTDSSAIIRIVHCRE